MEQLKSNELQSKNTKLDPNIHRYQMLRALNYVHTNFSCDGKGCKLNIDSKDVRKENEHGIHRITVPVDDSLASDKKAFMFVK